MNADHVYLVPQYRRSSIITAAAQDHREIPAVKAPCSPPVTSTTRTRTRTISADDPDHDSWSPATSMHDRATTVTSSCGQDTSPTSAMSVRPRSAAEATAEYRAKLLRQHRARTTTFGLRTETLPPPVRVPGTVLNFVTLANRAHNKASAVKSPARLEFDVTDLPLQPDGLPTSSSSSRYSQPASRPSSPTAEITDEDNDCISLPAKSGIAQLNQLLNGLTTNMDVQPSCESSKRKSQTCARRARGIVLRATCAANHKPARGEAAIEHEP
eukprot:SAG25_NODE_134_length_14400_cov_805.311049_16_plen_270_part_00